MQTQTGMEATELDKVESFMSSGEKYRNEWNYLIASLDPNVDQLRQLAYNGDLKVSKFRSVCWSVLLRVLSSNPLDWLDQREQQRRRYQNLKEEFAKNPHNNVLVNDNPLSQSKQSLWNQYFGDQELFSIIKQDVVRTFPGVDFFRKPFVQDAMTNILFYYAREHPYMSYRQGMHEILAPILFVMFYDHQSLLHFKELSENIDNLLATVLNPDFLEEDCYSIFSRLMSSIESYYRIANMIPTTEGHFPAVNVGDDFKQTSEVEVIGQLNYIRENILRKEDPYLYNHLQELEIPLHLFGIRWLRLLFGREFPLLDLLMLWDAIFAESDNFQLPNYILVAMLIRIRDKLILNDYTSCLTLLMRYPNNIDIGLVLRHALYMCFPADFEQPHNAFIYLPIENENSKQRQKTHSYQFPQFRQTNTLPRKQQKALKSSVSEDSVSVETETSRRDRSSSLTIKRNNTGSPKNNGNSESPIRQNDTNNTVEKLHQANMENLIRIEKFKASNNAAENVILDGYSSSEYLRLQLQNAQTIINVSQLKLKKYLETLRKYSRNGPDDLCQAVDGIGELCAFLDVKIFTPSYIQLPIDAAFEANENQIKIEKSNISPDSIASRSSKSKSSSVSAESKNSNKDKIKNSSINKRNSNLTDAEMKSEFVKILESTKHPYEIEIGKDSSVIDFKQNTKSDLLQTIPSSSNSTVKGCTRYEIPETFMQNTLKILGTRKDLELTIFSEGKGSESEGGLPNIDPLTLTNNMKKKENTITD
ncbi:TBC1 domain family member 5 homolog B isoform X2 [Condylostylus longicornis]|uniref:TBC1 domain family member 5 homolog B isoform X2 n=1 Tax=Condylostylus longicornis TaxID=2530218 RepID=UPI00244E3362|nr:TBC1 domain family member 5 homolog B isoform X2 [Condylostylus longicornis]